MRTRRARLRILLGLTAAFLSGAVCASASGFDASHKLYARVLKDRVRHGLVDYAGLKSDVRLDRYLDQISSVTRSDFDGWPEEEQLACLINLYNAVTLKLIADHYPVPSIKKIGGTFESSPWDQPLVRLFGTVTTLNELEETLRRDYDDPRMHFALVRAALGSAPLRGEPYVGAKLDRQLDDQARKFLSSPARNRIDRERRILFLSPIFHWYKDDFERKSDSVLSFIEPYLPPEVAKDAAHGRYSIKYQPFDWNLNELKAEPAPEKSRKPSGHSS